MHEPFDPEEPRLAPAPATATALARRLAHQKQIAELGTYAFTEPDYQAVMDRAVELAAEIFDVPLTKILKFVDDADSLKLVAGRGWEEGLVGHGRVGIDRESQAGYTLLSEAPVVVTDLARETRFSGPPLLHEYGVVAGMSVIIAGAAGRPFGVFGIHDTRARRFDESDADMLVTLANIVASSARQREAAERRNLASREVAHRSGNLLQLVRSIASQTFTTDRVTREAERVFSGRLAALSRANQLLCEDGWSTTRLIALVKEVLTVFPGRVEIQGRDIVLPADFCFDLSLILHEVATNSGKYGALSREAGVRASLSWQLEAGADGRSQLVLTWHDPVSASGPSATSAPRAAGETGFGKQLIVSLAEVKWGGRISESQSDGYRLVLQLPLPDGERDAAGAQTGAEPGPRTGG
ncbi:sensor histidine kinase [Marinicauda sp. Alg238-R41]|uniref:sensor histidine kinase n=1 Tax=Marinicauda sp. Alg238-R41 TaxID=2993447 RepID=UPI0022E6D7D1|nr:HWE histidine kinase domain-containing protein [Marinicauda sp. Alg238-R41]